MPGYGVRTWKVAVSMPCAIAHSTVRSKVAVGSVSADLESYTPPAPR